MTGWLTGCLTDLLAETNYLTVWLTDWLTIWLTDWLIWLTDWLTDWNCSARLPSKTKLWRSKTKHFCETSLKNEALKLKNEAFVRDFLQKQSFEDQKRSISARLPWKMKLWSSKTKLLCETSFKNEALKIKNEAFRRDFLQNISKWHADRTLDLRIPIRFNDLSGYFKSTAPATKKLSRGIRSPVTATRNDPCKATLPSHEICNPSTDSASEASNIDITEHEIPAPATQNVPFKILFKSTTPANVFATITNSCACHVFCNVSKSLRLPRQKHFELQKVVRDPGVLTILTSKPCSRVGVVQILATSTSKSAPAPSVFNDFDFQIALARRRGANFGDFNFQKCSRTLSF